MRGSTGTECVQFNAMEASMDGMAILAEDGVYIYLNHAHARIYGYDSPAELAGKTWQVLYEAEERRRFLEEIFPAFRKAGKWRGEAVGLRKDGSTFSQELSLTAFGKDGLICVVRDISLQKRYEQSLRDAAQAKQEFLSIVSHELKTPLTSISGYLGLLERKIGQADFNPGQRGDLLKLTDGARREGDRMAAFIHALLDSSRICAGKVTLAPERIDLREFVRENVDRLRNVDSRFESPISIEAEDPVYCRCDRLQLEQITVNLIQNALKFGAGKPVEITVQREASHARLIVRDHGIGISKEHQTRIFGGFERAVSPGEYEGSGLGLWIVARAVEAHGGSIRVESEPDQGTSFFVELPGAA